MLKLSDFSKNVSLFNKLLPDIKNIWLINNIVKFCFDDLIFSLFNETQAKIMYKSIWYRFAVPVLAHISATWFQHKMDDDDDNNNNNNNETNTCNKWTWRAYYTVVASFFIL
jgi:hypothetical protein